MNNTRNYTPENLLLIAIFGAHALSQAALAEKQHTLGKPVARMRGVRDAIFLLKQMDSDTAVTYGFIRKLIDAKAITSIRAGRKILVNLDELTAYLNMGGQI